MKQKLRKLWINERLSGNIDKLSIKEVRNLAGYYSSEDGKWEVNDLFEGEGYSADSIEEAEIISNQITIIGLLLEAKIKER